MRELLIGCGSRINKDIALSGETKDFQNVTTLDYNPDHNPDIVHDLTVHPLPFDDNTFDEIHAYDVLEHLAQQGDYEFFFNEFSEYWRILKDGGTFRATVPMWNGVWAWGDPSHKRVIQKESLIYLNQSSYQQIGKTKMSDFRFLYKADFKLIWHDNTDTIFAFVLKAVK